MNQNIRKDITIRPERPEDYEKIAQLVLQSFREGTTYSDGTGEAALIDEIRNSAYYIPKLSFVAELRGEIVGHFLFSRFPLSQNPAGDRRGTGEFRLVLLAPVAVRADHLREGIGRAMLTQGNEAVAEKGYAGILVEGNFRFYNQVGFRTSSEYGIYPTVGFPMEEPRCMMCQETYPGAIKGLGGYVVYDMYQNA